MTKEKNEKEKKEAKKVVKKVVKKPSVKTTVAKKLPVIGKIVKKRDKLIVEEPIKKVVKKITKPVVKKLVEKEVVEKPIIKERKKEIGILPIIKQKSDKEYYKGIGKRKRAVASVRLYNLIRQDSFSQGEKVNQGEKTSFIINNKPADIYFNNIEYQKIIYDSLEQVGMANKFKIQVLVRGGGLHAQAEAIRHGISRALLNFNEDFREKLKIKDLLTRDPRRRERKKFGLKRARKATQWRKR